MGGGAAGETVNSVIYCPSNQLFDEELGACTFASNVDSSKCKGGGTNIGTQPSPTTETTPVNTPLNDNSPTMPSTTGGGGSVPSTSAGSNYYNRPQSSPSQPSISDVLPDKPTHLSSSTSSQSSSSISTKQSSPSKSYTPPFIIPPPTANTLPNPNSYYCGYGWESANNECYHACPSGTSEECPGGRECHGGLTCTPATLNPAV